MRRQLAVSTPRTTSPSRIAANAWFTSSSEKCFVTMPPSSTRPFSMSSMKRGKSRVTRADYLYLAGSTKGERNELCVDSVEFTDDEKLGPSRLNRRLLDAVYDVIAAGVAREVSGGGLSAFTTALNETTCKFCPFEAICPGAGTVVYERLDVGAR